MGAFRDVLREAGEEYRRTYHAKRREIDHNYGATAADRRPLTADDYDSFEAALDERTYPSSSPKTIDEAILKIKRMNPVRWRQIEGDIKWLKKQMVKLGLNPEDARYLLP